MLRLLIAGLSCLLCASAWADDGKLVGVWKLKSFYIESAQTKNRYNDWGTAPKGFLVMTAERFTVIVTADGRKAPSTDEDRLKAFRSMIAYSGPFRIEGNRLTTRVEVSWNEAWSGTDQVRFIRLEGDRLFIESAPAPAINFPERGVVRGVLEWERSK